VPGEARPADAADARRRPPEPEPEPEPELAAPVLGLQRTAGNRAVAALLARQPAPGDTEAVPATEQKGATMTLGLGDLGVMPVDAATWALERSELTVLMTRNALSAKLMQAAAEGKGFDSAFLSTYAAKSTMTDVVLSGYSDRGESGGQEAYVQITLNFKAVEHDFVK
jgi:hypothetical protein